MRLVFVGGPAHGIVLELDALPERILAHDMDGRSERYEPWERSPIPGAVVYAPTLIDWPAFRRALTEIQALSV